MKKMLFVLLAVIIAMPIVAEKVCGEKKTGKKTETKIEQAVVEEPLPEITQECLANISLFDMAYKQKDYASAYDPWLQSYLECPNGSRAIYTRGEKLIAWKISNEQDPAKKQELINISIELYDKWIKYFGNNNDFPKGRILGRKACTYITYNPDKKISVYDWLKESVDLQGEKSEIPALQQFIIVSYEMYKSDNSFAEQFINDYLLMTDIADVRAKNPSEKNAAAFAQVKSNADALFLTSGVADCETLDKIFGEKVIENATNIGYLNNILSCYRKLRCNESTVYFNASEAAHKITPTAESANGCAEMSYKAGKLDDAIVYYEEAVNLVTEVEDKADYQFKMAQICSKLNRPQKAREYARLSLSNNPNDGRPYLLIGSLYAQAKIYDDPILQKTVYWAAVDKFAQAKRVDPNCTDDANRMINTYSQYFPSNEEVFMHPELGKGKSFRVEGWIGETTTCR